MLAKQTEKDLKGNLPPILTIYKTTKNFYLTRHIDVA